ncbi:hypothetical protein ANO11243_029290 [Dothideomycetidae sp. 11243]|nr:hypothetical protein ANO11243_029290 [fungal sp. No.11243]
MLHVASSSLHQEGALGHPFFTSFPFAHTLSLNPSLAFKIALSILCQSSYTQTYLHVLARSLITDASIPSTSIRLAALWKVHSHHASKASLLSDCGPRAADTMTFSSPLRPSINIFDALIDNPYDQKSEAAHISAVERPASYTSERQRHHIARVNHGEIPGDGMAKKCRGSRAAKWKPFDFRDSHESDLATLLESSRNTPLDVHAKVFQPTPPLRERTVDNSCGDFSRPSEYSHNSRPQHDEYMLYAGNRSREPGLNAYHIREESRTPAVTAPYDKVEINEIFGAELPSPTYCQSHPGTSNGQIQFCIHPNGDVSAQQWFDTQYQWINVGQYSNIRKRTEGQLASDRLKGETEEQSLRKNTLAYFHAIAKQREATVMGHAFGIEEIQGCLSNSSAHPTRTVDSSFQSASNASLQPLVPAFPRAGVNVHAGESRDMPEQADSADDPFSSQDSPTPATTAQRSFLSASVDAPSDSSYSTLTFGATSYIAGLERGQMTEPSALGTPRNFGHLPLIYGPSGRVEHGRSDNPHTRTHAFSSDRAKFQIGSGEQRFDGHGQSYFRDVVRKHNDSTSSRGTGTGSRTVMHDPFKETQRSFPAIATAEYPEFNSAQTTPTPSGPAESLNYSLLYPYNTNDPRERGTEVSKGFTAANDVYNVGSRLNGDSMLLKQAPTPQLLDERSLPVSLRHASWPHHRLAEISDYDAELRNWYRSGNKAERHEDFYQRILSYHAVIEAIGSSVAGPKSRDPGIIGPPTADRVQPAKGKRGHGLRYDPVITRLLIPVMENLASYVEGPAEQRHGYWAPFTAPPEWAVDKSLNGNVSFFDDEWGKPPERIGRDQRYRALDSLNFSRTSSGMTSQMSRSSSLSGAASGLLASDAWSPTAQRLPL